MNVAKLNFGCFTAPIKCLKNTVSLVVTSGVYRCLRNVLCSLLTLKFVVAIPVQAEWLSDVQPIMGTEIRVVLWSDETVLGRQAIAEVMTEMHRIDRQFSFYKPDSELSLINREAAQKPVAVSREMALVLKKALFYSRLTEGAFDVTFASIGQYYDYRKGASPTVQQRSEAVIDYRQVLLDEKAPSVSFTNPAIKLDLGGIVKGYAVDRAIAILKGLGIDHASISAGGDSYILGDRRGRPWMVGIKNPRGDGVALMLPLDNTAFSTSGDYERFFIDPQTGERIHHIINPSSQSSARGVASVSVLGPKGFDTDPLSTSVFILGVENGLELLNRLPDFEGVIIDFEGKVFYSEGLTPPG